MWETGLKFIDVGPWKMLGALWLMERSLGFAESLQKPSSWGAEQRDARILSIRGRLQHVLKVLYGCITWEGCFTSELKAYLVLSLLLALNPIV